MEIETIYLKNQVILIDKEADIKKDDFFYNSNTGIYKNDMGFEIKSPEFKIIASSVKLGRLPLLLLPDDYEAEKHANIYKDKGTKAINDGEDTGGATKRDLDAASIGVKIGYKEAKRNSFSKEDMIGLINFILDDYSRDDRFQGYWDDKKGVKITGQDIVKKYIDQKPKPQFIPEMEEVVGVTDFINAVEGKPYKQRHRPKVVDGKIIGKWEQPSSQP